MIIIANDNENVTNIIKATFKAMVEKGYNYEEAITETFKYLENEMEKIYDD